MTAKNKALLGVASLTTIGVVIYLSYRRLEKKQQRKISEQVSDEGYEFAHDILYPLKKNRIKRLFQ